MPYLSGNFPNPFSESTTITYSIPTDAPNSNLLVYDVTGKLVRSYQLSGDNNALTVNASEFNNGIYYYALQVNERVYSKHKMVVIK